MCSVCLPPKPLAEDENAPIEDRAKAAWAADPALRAEFQNSYDRYLAWRKAMAGGRVRLLRKQ